MNISRIIVAAIAAYAALHTGYMGLGIVTLVMIAAAVPLPEEE